MHPLFAKADRLSGEIIGAAIEVHRVWGRDCWGASTLSYMKRLNMSLGLSFDFQEAKLVDGISRLILPDANQA
jgi:hypothetical protein